MSTSHGFIFLMGVASSTTMPLPVSTWNPIRLREYLEKREGKIWKRKNTLLLVKRAEEIDALIEQLMRGAGVKIESGEIKEEAPPPLQAFSATNE